MALLAGALLAGCAPERGEAYLASFAAAERAFHAGRWVEAAEAWDGAAGKALRVKDRDEARFLEARAFERAEKWPEARATYQRLAADSPDGPRTGRAVFELASLEIAHGDAARGWTMLDEAARRFPAHGLARPAIRRLVMHAQDTGGEAAVLAFLDAHEAAFRGTELDEVIGYERALSLERAGRRKEAHDAFLASARRHPYPFGGLTDDAFWHAAAIDDEDGRYDEAIAHLRELLASREPSGAWSSYERPRYSQAQLRIAEIYRDRLKDRAAARREFDRLYALHTTTIKRDDALWAEARLALEDGDRAAACSLARRLGAEFPESRYVPCAHEICPGVPPAKRACADYPPAMRALRGHIAAKASTPGAVRGARALARGLETAPRRHVLFLFFFLFEVVVLVVVVVEVGVLGLFFVLLAGLVLEVDAEVAELRLEELEELVDIVAAPLVEDVGQELEEVAAVDAALDLFDLLLGERLEDVLAQGFGVALFDGIGGGEPNLPDGSLVEVDLHERCIGV